jgi:hypothetical protein
MGTSIVEVSVQLDQEAPVDAVVKPLQQIAVSYGFTATMQLLSAGTHRLTVKATDSSGLSGSVSLQVTGVAEAPVLPCRPNILWQNFGSTQLLPPFPPPSGGFQVPYSSCVARSLADLVAIVRAAEADSRHAHAGGSRWSFSDCAFTTDYAIDTTNLNKPLQTVQNAIAPGQPSPLVYHVEAGISIRDLYTQLDGIGQGLALETMGGSSGQTLAGAISTGTHGGDKFSPPLADSVMAIHLVGAGGTQYWIEPSAAITDPQLLRTLVAPGVDAANVIYDDATFQACLVSLGCMGIIYAVVLRVVPAYDLLESTNPSTWQDFVQRAPQLLADTSSTFLQVLVDPYVDSNTNLCLLTTRSIQAPNPPERHPRPDTTAAKEAAIQGMIFNFFIGDQLKIVASGVLDTKDIAKIVEYILLNMPNERPVVVNSYKYLLPALWPTGSFQDKSWAVMDTTAHQPQQSPVPGYSIEIFFPALAPDGSLGCADFVNALIDTVNAATNTVFTGYVSLRFMGATRAFLGMQQWKQTCSVEVSLYQGVQGQLEIITALLEKGLELGGLPHWGQMVDLNPSLQRDGRLYPGYEEWRRIYAKFSNDFKVRTFETALSTRWRLTTPFTSGELLSYGDAGTTGNVSSPVIVGLGGWQEFSFLFSGRDVSGASRIYAVNTSGELLSFGDDGTVGNVSSPVKVGLGGWQQFEFLFCGSDITGANRIYAVKPTGELLSYGDAGTMGNVSSPVTVGLGGWQQFRFVFAGRDISGANRIYAVKVTGELLSFGDDGTMGNVSSPVRVGAAGWAQFELVFAGRDITGADRIYAVTSTGELLSYGDAGTMDNVSSPVTVGSGGWQEFKFVFSGADATGANRIYAVIP